MFKSQSSQIGKATGKASGQNRSFFVVVRLGAAFQRSLSLWQRACKSTSPQKLLRVKYMGESGIDTGAMAKEFLSDVVVQMGSAMFPNDAPVDSAYDIQNNNFRSCGEIAATSIAQGGPAPRFLDETTYNMLVKPEIDMTSLNMEKHFTANDQELLENIKKDVKSHQDFILENGYTGVIDGSCKDDIIGTIMVSIIGRRLLYLNEFAEGLKINGVLETVKKQVQKAAKSCS